jgi:hypothetical protein
VKDGSDGAYGRSACGWPVATAESREARTARWNHASRFGGVRTRGMWRTQTTIGSGDPAPVGIECATIAQDQPTPNVAEATNDETNLYDPQ